MKQRCWCYGDIWRAERSLLFWTMRAPVCVGGLRSSVLLFCMSLNEKETSLYNTLLSIDTFETRHKVGHIIEGRNNIIICFLSVRHLHKELLGWTSVPLKQSCWTMTCMRIIYWNWAIMFHTYTHFQTNLLSRSSLCASLHLDSAVLWVSLYSQACWNLFNLNSNFKCVHCCPISGELISNKVI